MSSNEGRNYINLDEGVTLNGRHFRAGVNMGFVGDLCPLGNRWVSKSGAKPGRPWAYINAGIPFVQLTAFRRDLSQSVNRERNHRMFQTFRAFDLSGIRVLGDWNEADPQTNAVSRVEEDSFFIPLSDKSTLTPDELADLADLMAVRYGQDTFLFGDGTFVHRVDLITGEIFQIGSYESLDTQKLEQGWSRVTGVPSDPASQAIPAGPYIASKLAGSHRPNPKFAANDEDIPGKVLGEPLLPRNREGFRFKGYYCPSGSIQAILMLKAGTWA